MRALLYVAVAAAAIAQAQAKAVFAHFMVGNTENYTSADWEDDMRLAKRAHIDAFALNMAHGEAVNEGALVAAFSAASSIGIQLFFSFDYAGNGPWPQDTVVQYINQFASSSTYFHYNNKPFVSTFEGPDNANDWITIKAQTGCFFMPDWSSLGAKKAMAAGGGVADGLFSWAAWPWGYWDSWTYSDASYRDYLGGKPYMMPISPWFYTNLPGYNKNWLWRGDHIWGDRWFQASWWQPEFIEIISWNDFGESHYIGPVREHAMGAFEVGKAPYNYGTLPHDGWRDILPFVIDMYKKNSSTIDYERAVVWYKLVPAIAGTAICDRNGTVANTASQLQIEYLPDEVLDDKIFFIALLGKKSKVECIIGGVSVEGIFYQGPEGDGAGMYLGECSPRNYEGTVEVRITRPGELTLQLFGEDVSYDCSRWNGFSNFNAYVMSGIDPSSFSAEADDYSELACVNGTGMPKADTLCQFTCSLDYCPPGACVCTRFGKKPVRPKSTGVKGYPVAKLDASFGGLCSFACDYGFCPESYCTTTEVALPVWPESLFDPPYCTEGKSFDGTFDELCQFSCAHGFCPIGVCRCLATGFLNLLDPNTTSTAGTLAGINDYGLCNYACSRGFCPSNVCFEDTDLAEIGYGPYYDPVEDEYFDNDDPGDLTCQVSLAPKNLDDMVKAVDDASIPSICWNQWALNILFNTLLDFNDEFTASAKGYDNLFDAYDGWVKDSVGAQLESFMAIDTGKGNQYFDCVLTLDLHKYDKMGCQYLGLNKLEEGAWTIEYTLRDSDGFYAAVLDQLGIEKDWIAFGPIDLPSGCRDAGSDKPVGGGGRPCIKLTHKKINAPISVSKDKIKVPNPKEVIQAAMPNMTALADSLMVAQVDLTLHTNEADGGDIVTAASMPIFMLEQAIRSMDNIKEIGGKIIEENKKRLILEILSIVLIAIPFIGEAGGALFGGVVMVSRIAALIDVAGSTALTAYDIVQDPSSAPFAILGLLVGGFGGGVRSEKEAFGEAAKARKGLSASDIAKFGDDFVAKDSKVQKIVNGCLRA
ncbi:Putative glycoside hydrolase family 71 [Colletotrichum destructivum]|uniref:Glycoside hydrolase family 71 n=1 Tax=Colletotrichum destructivum TaxID=34406 RepID=A0AAX4IL97_9PEZI|nr:Putative glycoside hydrolase family 71 [Colletotrichum destructivum]